MAIFSDGSLPFEPQNAVFMIWCQSHSAEPFCCAIHRRNESLLAFLTVARQNPSALVFCIAKFIAHDPPPHLSRQTEHDFNLEKQTLVHEAKLQVQDDFRKKEKDREVQERIARSAEIGECRVKKMKLRDDLLNTLIAEAGAKCAVVARGSNYPQLLQKLIVQALIKIEENDVTVYCRTEDLAIVTKVLPAAIDEYVQIMMRESTVKLSPIVTLNPERAHDLADTTYGGIMLTADSGKIVCDNTMASRLGLVYEELLPSIRAILFPEEQ